MGMEATSGIKKPNGGNGGKGVKELRRAKEGEVKLTSNESWE